MLLIKCLLLVGLLWSTAWVTSCVAKGYTWLDIGYRWLYLFGFIVLYWRIVSNCY